MTPDEAKVLAGRRVKTKDGSHGWLGSLWPVLTDARGPHVEVYVGGPTIRMYPVSEVMLDEQKMYVRDREEG